MANRIFTNGEEGKILTSVGNRIIKQPYEFGNAFQNRMGLNNYIKISGLNFNFADTTDLMWINESGTGNLYYITKKASTQNYNTTRIANSLMFVRNNSSIINTVSWATSLGIHLIGVKTNSTGSLCSFNNITSSQSSGFQHIIQSIFTDIIIGGTVTSETSSLVPSIYNTTAKFNRYTLYSRYLSNNEILYTYANKIGNDPQSTLNIVIDLRNDKAEIIDFSALQDGSDMRVGCRDYSGFNRHGEIMNLPAGTLQQKVDYANANLFVPFLT